MGRPRRLLRTLKWVGTVVVAVVLGLWVLSIGWPGSIGPRWTYATNRGGTISLHHHELIVLHNQYGVLAEFTEEVAAFIGSLRARCDEPLPWSSVTTYGLRRPRYWHLEPFPRQNARPDHAGPPARYFWTMVVLPYWLLLLLFGVPAAVLWWRDRRRIPAGHCRQCGYNLTGNVSGVCPECGVPIGASDEG